MPYLQNIAPEAIPRNGYHVARWHGNGKLWISKECWRCKSDAESMAHDLQVSTRGVRTDYFVWQAGDVVQDPEYHGPG